MTPRGPFAAATASAGGAGLTEEQVRDLIHASIVAPAGGGVTRVIDDAADTISLTAQDPRIQTCKQSAALTALVATTTTVPGMSFPLEAGFRYELEFDVAFQSSDTTNGAAFMVAASNGLVVADFQIAVFVRQGAVGVDAMYESTTETLGASPIGSITSSVINTPYPALVRAFMSVTTAGTAILQARRNGAGAGTVDILNRGGGRATRFG